MMEAVCVDPSPVDVILIHSQSRFFRDVTGYSFWKRKLEKYGVSVVSMTQDFGEGSSANFAETVLAAADQYSSEETAKHVTRTMLEKCAARILEWLAAAIRLPHNRSRKARPADQKTFGDRGKRRPRLCGRYLTFF